MLACSGGLDSVVMTHLFKDLGYDLGVAHCNFSLRGKESDADETFVSELAEQLGLAVFIETFDTKKFAKEQKVSTQMAARELRYGWFNEIATDFKYDYILTAHHANDNLETLLINVSRGTGIRGLTGIKVISGNIVRPLLFVTREDLFQYAKKQKYYWREDSSNASNDYLRNELRHRVIPPFLKATPNLLANVHKTQAHLQETALLLEDYMALVYRLAVTEKGNGYSIDILKLTELPNTNALLYELLHPFGFTAWEDILDLLSAQSGKQIFSNTHRLIKDRSSLLLTEIIHEDAQTEVNITASTREILEPVKMSFKIVESMTEDSKNTIYVDKSLIEYPLVLRKWREGDVFQPFGMKGKKKLSKFFKDEKLSLVAKEKIHVLCSLDRIIWVIGLRLDDRFKVRKETTQILKIHVET